MLYSFQEKETSPILFSGEVNWGSTVFSRRKQELYCFQEKETGGLKFSEEGNWCSTLSKTKLY